MTWLRQGKAGAALTLGVAMLGCAQAGGPGSLPAGKDAEAVRAQADLPAVVTPQEAAALVPGTALVPGEQGYRLMTRGGGHGGSHGGGRAGGGSFFIGTSGSPGGAHGAGGGGMYHGGGPGSRPGGGGGGMYHGGHGGDHGARPGGHGGGVYHGGGHGGGSYHGHYGHWNRPWYGGYGWNYGFNRYYDSLWYYPYGSYMFPFYRGIGGAYYPYVGVDSPYLQYVNGAWQPQALGTGQATPAATSQAWIVIQGNQFFPKDATLTPGTTVVFYNADSTAHRVHSTDLGGLDTGVIDPGKSSAPITVSGTGVMRVTSLLHPEAQGMMTVR